MKKFTLLLSAMLLAWATNLWAGDATITLNNLGDGLGTTSNTTISTTNVMAAEAGLGTFTLNYLQGKKEGNAILLAKSTGAFISNKTPIPGAIKSVEVFINSGAAGKATYYCAFSTSECTKAYTAGSSAVNITGGNSNTYTCAVVGAKYFCISLGNANNGQVLKVVITYESSTLNSIALSGNPTKKEYMAGESLNTDGLVVTGTYSDGSTKSIAEGITWLIDPDPLTAGTTTVDVIASVKNAAGEDVTSDVYEVTGLTVTAAKTLTSIAVSGTPAEFWKGDTFNHDGMTVTANWDDNSTT
ncbi:MAG: bacterial Ig-like domain-containing protein, partial [Paludibacteraceae bacterium]